MAFLYQLVKTVTSDEERRKTQIQNGKVSGNGGIPEFFQEVVRRFTASLQSQCPTKHFSSLADPDCVGKSALLPPSCMVVGETMEALGNQVGPAWGLKVSSILKLYI